jgi:SAM-dependent methyltransferase
MNYLNEYKKIFDGGKFLRNGREITLKEYPAFDGGGVRSLIPKILQELEKRKSVTVLDYGCGTAIHWHLQTLVKNTKSLPNVLGDKVQGYYRYDPAYELYSKKPETKFDFILCSDVLEHIPNDQLDNFFEEIHTYAKPDSVIFYSISTVNSSNLFLNGENMHITINNRSF